MDTLYLILQSSHSGFRWISLFALVATIVIYLPKWKRKANFTKTDKKVFSVSLSILHLQVLIGIALYLLSPKVQFSGETMSSSFIRFFTVEHSLMMIISVILLTIGSVKIKKKSNSEAKFKTGFWFTLITLVIILLAIPWPFQELGAGWF